MLIKKITLFYEKQLYKIIFYIKFKAMITI